MFAHRSLKSCVWAAATLAIGAATIPGPDLDADGFRWWAQARADHHRAGGQPPPRRRSGRGDRSGGHFSGVDPALPDEPPCCEAIHPESDAAQLFVRVEAEALAAYEGEMARFYSLTADEAAEAVRLRPSETNRHRDPLHNLALYRLAVGVGTERFSRLDGALTPASRLDLAAIFLGAASDSRVPITEETVFSLNRMFGLPRMSVEERRTLARKADKVRQGIVAGETELPHP